MPKPPKPLPIVWYVDDSELPKESFARDNTVKKIADALTAWEDAGDQTLNELRAVINEILGIE